MTAVRIKSKTANRKLAPVAMIANSTAKLRPVPQGPFVTATYLPIEQSCPTTCVFHRKMQNGKRPCYADAGFTGRAIRVLEENAQGLKPLELARLELEALDRLFNKKRVPRDGARGGRDLRLHISGDARTVEAAEVMAEIAERWAARGGGKVWSYTHAWRNVPRRAWGKVSVLASIDRPEQAHRAQDQGYALALVVRTFPGKRRFEVPYRAEPGFDASLTVVPCPAETKAGVTCSSCRLCFDEARLRREGLVIGFAAHGMGAGVAKRRLPVVGQRELAF